MKKVLPLIVLFGSTSNAFAAGGPGDGSRFFVWGFLGFCVLLFLAQVVPAILVLYNLFIEFASKGKRVEAFASWGSE